MSKEEEVKSRLIMTLGVESLDNPLVVLKELALYENDLFRSSIEWVFSRFKFSNHINENNYLVTFFLLSDLRVWGVEEGELPTPRIIEKMALAFRQLRITLGNKVGVPLSSDTLKDIARKIPMGQPEWAQPKTSRDTFLSNSWREEILGLLVREFNISESGLSTTRLIALNGGRQLLNRKKDGGVFPPYTKLYSPRKKAQIDLLMEYGYDFDVNKVIACTLAKRGIKGLREISRLLSNDHIFPGEIDQTRVLSLISRAVGREDTKRLPEGYHLDLSNVLSWAHSLDPSFKLNRHVSGHRIILENMLQQLSSIGTMSIDHFLSIFNLREPDLWVQEKMIRGHVVGFYYEYATYTYPDYLPSFERIRNWARSRLR